MFWVSKAAKSRVYEVVQVVSCGKWDDKRCLSLGGEIDLVGVGSSIGGFLASARIYMILAQSLEATLCKYDEMTMIL